MQVSKRLDQGLPGADWRSVVKDLLQAEHPDGPMTEYNFCLGPRCDVCVCVCNLIVGRCQQ